MPCFEDGQPICCPIEFPSPERIILRDLTIDMGADAIDINQTMTKNVVMEQITVHWASPLSTSELITLSKFDTINPGYSTILIRFDPFIDQVFDWVNVTPFRWNAGENVYLYYQNTDDIGIGAEIILRVV